MDEPVPFDPEAVVKQYGDVCNRLCAEESDLSQMEFRAIAAVEPFRSCEAGAAPPLNLVQRLRVVWAEWRGEDCLHEMRSASRGSERLRGGWCDDTAAVLEHERTIDMIGPSHSKE